MDDEQHRATDVVADAAERHGWAFRNDGTLAGFGNDDAIRRFETLRAGEHIPGFGT